MKYLLLLILVSCASQQTVILKEKIEDKTPEVKEDKRLFTPVIKIRLPQPEAMKKIKNKKFTLGSKNGIQFFLFIGKGKRIHYKVMAINSSGAVELSEVQLSIDKGFAPFEELSLQYGDEGIYSGIGHMRYGKIECKVSIKINKVKIQFKTILEL